MGRSRDSIDGLIEEILSRVGEDEAVLQPPRTARLSGILGAELDLRLKSSSNRYSVEKSMSSLHALQSHPDIGPSMDGLRDATCMDFGCGSLSPIAGVFAMLLAGARRGIAIDVEEVESVGCAVRALYATLSAALTRTSRPKIAATADQILKRVASFDWDKVAAGDVNGVDWSRLSCLQKPLVDAGLDDGSIDVLVSNSVFEHLADPDEILTEMARIVRPGGLCMHAIDGVDHRSYADSTIDPLAFLNDESTDPIVHGCNRIRPLQFTSIFERHGFEVRGIRQGPRTPIPDELVRGFAPQFRDLAREHLEVPRARFYLRRR